MMWICCTILVLFLFLERGHQAENMVPENITIHIVQCSGINHPIDCSDLFARGWRADGVYMIYPGGWYTPAIPVYCDMTSDIRPWTVFQKRFDGSVSFYRGWKEYEDGFGQANGEYWLGLKNIHLLTQKKSYQLWINLEDFDNDARYVTYEFFSISKHAVSAKEDGYNLRITGFMEGDKYRPAGDSLQCHNGMNFSTYDNDRDEYNGNCAVEYEGAFRYKDCHSANLNGLYLEGNTAPYAIGMTWSTWRGQSYSLKKSEMKITEVLY